MSNVLKLDEQMLKKFSGDVSGQPVEEWVEDFETVSEINGWDESTQLQVLKLWLVGEARRFKVAYEKAHGSVSVELCLEKLTERFGYSKVKKVRPVDVFQLQELKPRDGESVTAYGLRFQRMAESIPVQQITPALSKAIYLRSLKEYDQQLWWHLVSQVPELKQLSDVMAEVERLEDKSGALYEKDSRESGKHGVRQGGDYGGRQGQAGHVSESVGEEWRATQKSVQSLANQLKDLTLLVKSQSAQNGRAGSGDQGIICYNCQQAGHNSTHCPLPNRSAWRSQGQRQRQSSVETQQDIRRPSTPQVAPPKRVGFVDTRADQAQLYVGVQSNKDEAIVAGVTNKRMRIENLLDNRIDVDSVPTNVTKLGKKKPSSKKKKKVSKPMSTIPDKILEQRAPVSIGQLFDICPVYRSEMIKTLTRADKKPKAKSALLVQTTQEPLLSYIKVDIGQQEVPVFVDNGAAHSLILESLVERLGLSSHELVVPVKLTSVQGLAMLVTKSVTAVLRIEEDVAVKVKFLVLTKCAVPILLGMDVIQRQLKANINYGTETFEFDYKDACVRTTLYSKQSLKQQEKVDEFESDSDEEGSEGDDESSDSYEESVTEADDDLVASVEDNEIVAVVSEEEIIEVAEKAEGLTADQRKKLQDLLVEFKSVFATGFDELPGIKDSTYRLEVPEDAKPVGCKLRRYNAREKGIIQEEVQKMLEGGIIEECRSEWASPVVLIQKKDGSVRFCVDYRKLNEMTEKNKFPLGRMEDCLDSMAGKKVFSLMDCYAGYWQIELAVSTRKYTAFVTPFGQYQFIVLP